MHLRAKHFVVQIYIGFVAIQLSNVTVQALDLEDQIQRSSAFASYHTKIIRLPARLELSAFSPSTILVYFFDAHKL